MAGRRSRGRWFVTTAHKPHGVIQPRVGREHFGIVSSGPGVPIDPAVESVLAGVAAHVMPLW
jgi:hypothetical protein